MTAKEDLKNQRISVTIHTVAAIIIGSLSPFIGNPFVAFAVVIFIGIFVGRMTQRFVGKQKFAWWMGNGLLIYIILWLVVWVFVANYF